MQTVGAQWLMLALTGSTAYVALIQTAASLPIVLFAVLAGALGDLVDRRKFLLITQVLMLVAAAALGALAIAGLVTPWLLLALIFAVGHRPGAHLTDLADPAAGTGVARRTPAGHLPRRGEPEPGPRGGPGDRRHHSRRHQRRDRLPDQRGDVPRRARGDRVWWRGARTHRRNALPREHFGEAVRAGGRYVSASPELRVILLRAGVFVFFASAIWALLPVTAQSQLHLGSGGYGLLLGCVGVGAVAGAAVLLPALRNRLGPGRS